MSRCKALTRKDKPCKNNSLPDEEYCLIHLKRKKLEKIPARKTKSSLSIINIVGFFIGLLGLYLAFQSNWNDSKRDLINATSGTIISNENNSKKTLAIGNAYINLDTKNNVVLYDQNEPLLSMKLLNQKLLVSLIIRNKNGEVVAEIIDNEWKLNENNYFHRNYTETSLEVIDNDRDVILQVVCFQDVFYFAGIFMTKDGKVVALMPLERDLLVKNKELDIKKRNDKLIVNGFGCEQVASFDSKWAHRYFFVNKLFESVGKAIIDTKPTKNDLIFKLKPLFKYPSEYNIGVLDKSDKLRNILDNENINFHFGDGIDLGNQYKNFGTVVLI